MNNQRIREEIEYRIQSQMEGKRYPEERTEENRIQQIESFHTLIKNLCKKLNSHTRMDISVSFTLDICTKPEYDDEGQIGISINDFPLINDEDIHEEFADESFKTYYKRVMSSLPYMLKVSNAKNYEGCIMNMKIKNLEETNESERVNENLSIDLDSKGWVSLSFCQSYGESEERLSSELSIYGKFLKNDIVIGHIKEHTFLCGLISDIITYGNEYFCLQYA